MGLNWHAVLGVSPDSSPEEVKAAYTRLVKIHHPDHGGGNELFILIQEAYEQYLSEKVDYADAQAFTATERKADINPVTKPILKHRRRNFIIAGIVFGMVILWLCHPHRKQLAPQASAAAATCPTGKPEVTVTAVQLLPDPDLDPPSALYMVMGTITNSTTGTLSVGGIGFYFGQVNPLRPPDWSDSMGDMDVSADPTQIMPGETIQWRDKQVEILDQPAGTNVSAALSYPDSVASDTSFQWDWTDSGTGCPSPNAFDN